MPIQFWITLGYVGVAIAIGVTSARGRIMSKVEEWGLAGHAMGFMVMYFLNAAGIISAFSMLGAPGFAYVHGVAICYLVIYVALQEIIAFYVAPKVWEMGFRMGHLTQAQAVAERYESPFLGAAFAVVTSFGLIAYAVTQAMGCAYVLNAASGGRLSMGLGASIVMVSMAAYIFIGGMRAIGWTNVFQGILMFVMAWVAGVWVAKAAFGSWWFGEIFRSVAENSPKHLTLPGPMGAWSYRFFSSSIIVSTLSIWPTGWVWWMGAKDLKVLRRSIALMPLFLFMLIPTLSLGFAAITLTPGLKAPDQAALAVANAYLPPILAGLLGAGVLAAAMSSAEPCLHVTALTYAVDVISPVAKLPKEKCAKLARALTVVVALCIVLPLALLRPASLVYVTLIGYGFLGQSFPALMGVLFWRWATRMGALSGLLVGFAVTTALSVARIHPMGIHAGAWGLAANFAVFLIVSYFTGSNRR
ncbi:MAG TPA: sodium:solute symporter family protein [Thermosynergistes sp.]|nr:sodium:solute symporter family protein [Thermosynergistes sp.]